jgi:signal peptidase I
VDVRAADSFTQELFDIWKDVGKESALRVSGWSMYPLIEDGDEVLIMHSHDAIRAGDTIAFKHGQRIIVHRVLRCYDVRGKTSYVNRGDNNLHIDSRVGDIGILGRVVAVVKKNGKKVGLESPLFRMLAYTILMFFELSRLLPKRLSQIRVAKVLDRLALRMVSVT